jgi:hypothetical protein
MRPRTTGFRVFRMRLRSVLAAIAILGLIFAVIVQTVRLERAGAELRLARARADANF